MAKVLIVNSDKNGRDTLAKLLSHTIGGKHDVVTAASIAEANQKLRSETFDVAVVCPWMTYPDDGSDLSGEEVVVVAEERNVPCILQYTLDGQARLILAKHPKLVTVAMGAYPQKLLDEIAKLLAKK